MIGKEDKTGMVKMFKMKINDGSLKFQINYITGYLN